MTRRDAPDSMIQLALMPFPFFNPLNWPGMTPSRAIAASLFVLRCTLDGWRHVGDALQASLRAQQDAMLAALQHNIDHAATAPTAASAPAPRRRVSKAPPQATTAQATRTLTVAAAAPQ